MNHVVWVAGLEGSLVSLSLGWLRGGAACFIEFGLVVWRGRLFHLVWLGCLEGPLVSFSLGWWKLRRLGRSNHASLLGNF